MSYLNKMLCPVCGSGFKLENSQTCPKDNLYGLLVCSCNEYPLVAGIPIIKTHNELEINKIGKIVKLIRKGRYQDALNAALIQLPDYPNLNNKIINAIPERYGLKRIKRKIHDFKVLKWEREAYSFFRKIDKNTTATELFKFYFLKSGKKRDNPYDYFTYRFGQPRHLSALSLARSIEVSTKPVLDVGCGFGHITRGLTNRHNVIGIDNNFYLLYVAKHWIAPKAEFICCEGDTDLPFSDNTFCSTICVNSFHFFSNKDHSVKEMKRVIDDKGSIILAAIHHSKTKTKTPNTALSVSEYTSLFRDMSHTILSDNVLLERYKNKLGPALNNQYSVKDIEKEKLISLIATHDKEKLVDHGEFDEWPHGVGRLEINPLYVTEGLDAAGNKEYLRKFPSKFYEDENHHCKSYLPHSVNIDEKLFDEITAKHENPDMADIEDLVANCVLLDIPERYHK